MKNIYILFFVILVIILVVIRPKINEGFNSDASFNNIFLLDQKYTSYDNLHNPYRHMYESLNFPEDGAGIVVPADDTVNNYSPAEYPKPFGYDNVGITAQQESKLEKKQLPQSNKQPGLEIVDGKFYRDWKWPQMPVAIEFGLNPDKYCSAHPGEYPCFRYYQRY